MKARRIKEFRTPFHRERLSEQHNFANMFAALHPAVRVGGFFQRE
jgi:hypothetical protein